MPVTIKQAHLKYKDPDTGEYVSVSAIGSPLDPVLDVQIGNSSVVDTGVASIPIANDSTLGVVKTLTGRGIGIDTNGSLYTMRPTTAQIKAAQNDYGPITPYVQHYAVFYGLAKAAGDTTQINSNNAVGVYTDEAKTAVKTMLGIPTDIQINGTSIIDNGVVNIPFMTTSVPGVAMRGPGLYISNGTLGVNTSSSSDIKSGTTGTFTTVGKQHEAIFYGLAKAAGDTTQSSSSNPVGTYTDNAKTSIRTMLGVLGDVQVNGTSVVTNGVANIPLATGSTAGTVLVSDGTYGLKQEINNQLAIAPAQDNQIKEGTATYKPIAVSRQHQAVFYGLAKAAGDTTQAVSSNSVGVYTPAAKTAIQSMLGVDPGVVFVEEVTGRAPTINGVSNTRYICGEVDELTITPPSSGTIDVRFTSGTTPTVLSIPNTVKFPEWIDLLPLEESTVYEIIITDGIYGGVMTWPV